LKRIYGDWVIKNQLEDPKITKKSGLHIFGSYHKKKLQYQYWKVETKSQILLFQIPGFQESGNY
jgi:hypothetical protein